MAEPTADVIAALRLGREEFASNYPWPFLVGEPMMHAPRTAMRTLTNAAPALRKLDTMSLGEATPAPDASVGALGLIVIAIRKRHDIFPEMITIGRTANNDVVIPDATISKFHAYFRTAESGLELVDAGSRNGTRVMGRVLAVKQPAEVSVGTRVRFGSIDLIIRDAGETWDAVRKRER